MPRVVSTIIINTITVLSLLLLLLQRGRGLELHAENVDVLDTVRESPPRHLRQHVDIDITVTIIYMYYYYYYC